MLIPLNFMLWTYLNRKFLSCILIFKKVRYNEYKSEPTYIGKNAMLGSKNCECFSHPCSRIGSLRLNPRLSCGKKC